MNDGSYIACGNDATSINPVIIKADASGQVTWVKTISSPSTTIMLRAIDVGECVGGGYYLFGIGAAQPSAYYYLSKIDILGNVLWTKTFDYFAPYSNPKFFQKPNGYFVIIPALYSGTGIITLDANGNYLWGKMFTDDPKCPGFAGASCTDGGTIISGKDGSDILIIKMDANGTVQWSARYQDVNLYSQTRVILQTQDGNYFIAGLREDVALTFSGSFAMKIDANGNTLWHKLNFRSGLFLLQQNEC